MGDLWEEQVLVPTAMSTLRPSIKSLQTWREVEVEAARRLLRTLSRLCSMVALRQGCQHLRRLRQGLMTMLDVIVLDKTRIQTHTHTRTHNP